MLKKDEREADGDQGDVELTWPARSSRELHVAGHIEQLLVVGQRASSWRLSPDERAGGRLVNEGRGRGVASVVAQRSLEFGVTASLKLHQLLKMLHVLHSAGRGCLRVSMFSSGQ